MDSEFRINLNYTYDYKKMNAKFQVFLVFYLKIKKKKQLIALTQLFNN